MDTPKLVPTDHERWEVLVNGALYQVRIDADRRTKARHYLITVQGGPGNGDSYETDLRAGLKGVTTAIFKHAQLTATEHSIWDRTRLGWAS